MTTSDTNSELLVGFIDESIDSLLAADGLFVALEANPTDMEIVNAIFRPVHSLKGNAAYFGFMKIKKLAHTMENLLDRIRNGLRLVDRSVIDVLLPGMDFLRTMLGNVRDGDTEMLDEIALSSMLANIENLLGAAVPEIASTILSKKDDHPLSETEQAKDSGNPKAKHEKTMRILEHSLDDFLRCVGDLLGVEEMLRHLSRQINSGVETSALSSGIKEVVTQFEGISKELRSKIMEVRKVEARILLQKAPRIVRDISIQSGKKINVICIGEEISIDKSYIDLLDAPLTHMVRNAADHGVEQPAVRTANGKPETGTVTVSIKEHADDLQLTVRDDGAGLNYEGLRKKAISVGLISESAPLSKSDIVDLLFQSGVSTATTVTDISGRGVGMDVVKRAVVDVGGKIEVDSTPGAGTTFTVTVPRNASTQIFDGYMVRCFSGESYVLPLGQVVEAFGILPAEVSGIVGKEKIVNRKGNVFPLHELDSLFGSAAIFPNPDQPVNKMGVVIEIRGKKTVLAVKEIIGIQKVVCKQVEGSMLDNEFFDGASISGTGHVSMIINVEKLLGKYL